jgi:hypothetical protein
MDQDGGRNRDRDRCFLDGVGPTERSTTLAPRWLLATDAHGPTLRLGSIPRGVLLNWTDGAGHDNVVR